MTADIFGAVAAFAVGVLIAAVNFLIAKYMLKKHPDAFAATTVLRQLLAVLYLALIMFGAKHTPWDQIYLLIGGALGVTLPMFFFTTLLLKINKDTNDKGKEQ